MTTLSIEVPEQLAERLEAIAETRKMSPAEVVREAISVYLSSDAPGNGSQPRSFFEAAQDLIGCLEGPGDQGPSFIETPNPQPSRRSALESMGDLIGCLEGPGDLSTNPAHMEGFGESKETSR